MKRFIFTGLILLSINLMARADNWYVTAKGNDDNNGHTEATAFRTLQKAANLVQPGDVVLIGNGEYTSDDRSNGSAVLNISRSGKPDAWITWRAMAGEHPEIKPTGWCGIQITGSYQIIDGLTVTGRNDAIALVDAQADAKNTVPDPSFNTNGILVTGRPNKPDQKPHHVIIRNCVVGKCPGAGITAIHADYVTIEDCKVFGNAWFMRYAGSGISTLDNWAHDDAPGYHMIIQRNFVWNNKTLVAWEKIGKLSDGNGIIMDVTDQDNQGATNPNGDAVVNPAGNKPIVPAIPEPARRPVWKGHSLVANNLSAYNGGSGIHTFRTKNVDIVNNTTYWNGQIVGYAELFANASENITIVNNIIVPRPGGKVTVNSTRNKDIHWDYNLYPVDQQVLKGPHDIVADPLFIDAGEFGVLKSNFRVMKNSAARHSGTNELEQPEDIDGEKRSKSVLPDRGAFAQ